MAFGFGFNKQKALSSAEKFVQQGKLQNAISEYEKVLKADPKDLTVSNTVGDLYARLGQNDKAITCFKSVGDAYASQGFTVKAIAMYKKLTKLKPALESVLRLAELYTQQGLFNDARAQYLQVAEEFLKTGDLEQAVRIFQKTLEMDPENTAMRMRLAEAYIRLGKKTEAMQIFASAADTLRSRGQPNAIEEIVQRMLKVDAGNSYALLLRGRSALDSGDVAGAIKHLEKIADLDTHPDGLRALMQTYIQSGRFPEAGNLAAKLANVHNDVTAITEYANALASAGHFDEMLEVYRQHSDRLFSGESTKIVESLHSAIGHVKENPVALEALLGLLQKAGDTTHITEVYELLAHGYVHSGDLEKARDYYLKLTQLEPQNHLHTRNYQQVLARLSGTVASSKLITAEEGAVLVDELEATAPFIDQRYPDEVALAIRAALTDAELFVSYNMPAKALGPLMSALPKAPRDLRLNQRLAALHTRASRFAEAAVCCRTLESIYHDAGHAEEATRYGELAEKYEERAGLAAAPEAEVEVTRAAAAPSASPAPAPAAPAAGLFWHTPSPSKSQEPADFEVQAASAPAEDEIDISDEWEGEVSGEPESVPAAEAVAAAKKSLAVEAKAAEETIEEIRFYLAQSMIEQARAVFAKLLKLKPSAATISALRHEIEGASQQAASAEPEVVEEAFVEEPTPVEEIAPPAAPKHKSGVLKEFVPDLESSLGEGFLPVPPAREITPQPAPVMAEVAQAIGEPARAGVLGEFVCDLEASLGDSFLPQAPVPQTQVEAEPQAAMAHSASAVAASAAPAAMASAAAVAPAPQPGAGAPTFTYQPAKMRPLAPQKPAVPSTGAGVDLADMFGELKQELEEDTAAAQEDPETHYNLGVAFREMGLLDEAIAELQKVCHAVDRGHPFSQIMQTYTWLAQCFLDKGVPEAAIRWYERALKLSSIDEETRTALNYELASAYENAGNKPAALSHFMEVYGSNIDYRDVAERIKALKS
jgi:tetratricopeptide (TPR) repeat protein